MTDTLATGVRITRYETVNFAVENKVAFITLNRPEAGNAINRRMHAELADIWRLVNSDDGIWSAVITGAGSDFSIGDDLDEMAAIIAGGGTPETFSSEIDWQRRFRRLGAPSGLPSPTQGIPGKPLIAAIQGRCWDSAVTIAAHADFAVGDTTASFAFPQVQAGLAPVEDVMVLSRLIARGPATRLALLGGNEAMSAERAHELGLLIDLVEPGAALERATELATILNEWSAPLTVRGSKAAIFGTYNLPYDKAQLMSHAYLNQVRFHSEDAKEGPRAFAEKRKPNWQAK